MITTENALKIHQILIRKYGGIQGVRDRSLLDSAIERPYSGLKDSEFYPNAEEKAAAIIESIVKNHPFYDGNKRTGYVLMRVILLENQMDIEASKDEKYRFVIDIASGNLDFQNILNWIRSRLIEK